MTQPSPPSPVPALTTQTQASSPWPPPPTAEHACASLHLPQNTRHCSAPGGFKGQGVCVCGGAGGMLTPVVKHPSSTTNSPCGRHQRSLSAPGPELPVVEICSVCSSPGRGGWTPGGLCSGAGPRPQGASQGLEPLRPVFRAVQWTGNVRAPRREGRASSGCGVAGNVIWRREENEGPMTLQHGRT